MNKDLLKEIAEEAGFRLTHPMSGLDPNIIFAPANYNAECNVELENFAKLIMKECISACATDRLGKEVGAAELIKAHFGIRQ